MKKTAYKGRKGSAFRTYFHGNSKTNGCTFRRVGKGTDGKELLSRYVEEDALEARNESGVG